MRRDGQDVEVGSIVIAPRSAPIRIGEVVELEEMNLGVLAQVCEWSRHDGRQGPERAFYLEELRVLDNAWLVATHWDLW